MDDDSYISGALMGCQELVNVLQVPHVVDVVAPRTDPLYQQGTHLQLSWVSPHNGSQPSGGTNAVTLFTLQSVPPNPWGQRAWTPGWQAVTWPSPPPPQHHQGGMTAGARGRWAPGWSLHPGQAGLETQLPAPLGLADLPWLHTARHQQLEASGGRPPGAGERSVALVAPVPLAELPPPPGDGSLSPQSPACIDS